MATFFQRGILPTKRGSGSCDRGVEILMEKVTDLEVIRATKKEFCLYCGKEAHKFPLCCPRIAAVEIDPEVGVVTGLSFWGDFWEEDSGDAA